MRGDVFLAVKSIPFYVETCKLFVALVPTLQHNDFHGECNYCTWLSRQAHEFMRINSRLLGL